MAHARETQDGTGGIGTGWRLFQVMILAIATSWLLSYALFRDPVALLSTARSADATLLERWGALVLACSPVMSLIIVLLAVAPDRLAFLQGDGWRAAAARALLLAVAGLWTLNVFIQFLTGPSMLDKLLAEPMAPALVAPVTGGVFFHVVFQHWLQALAAIVLALAPEKFSALTESPVPAGVQWTVLDRG